MLNSLIIKFNYFNRTMIDENMKSLKSKDLIKIIKNDPFIFSRHFINAKSAANAYKLFNDVSNILIQKLTIQQVLNWKKYLPIRKMLNFYSSNSAEPTF
ncbi:hypothetical protein BpHYR1_040561 [Brachionus plicatilis]|uniref:Uncharacterized protein n=1 Tax=Brachionus plicatilis TaxID=10195 RepID=A0A3M7PE82_BRAPC|nr:hypothetical protein BpHYR1_040561 [Brachionus plicatilis]